MVQRGFQVLVHYDPCPCCRLRRELRLFQPAIKVLADCHSPGVGQRGHVELGYKFTSPSLRVPLGTVEGLAVLLIALCLWIPAQADAYAVGAFSAFLNVASQVMSPPRNGRVPIRGVTGPYVLPWLSLFHRSPSYFSGTSVMKVRKASSMVKAKATVLWPEAFATVSLAYRSGKRPEAAGDIPGRRAH